MTGTNSWRPVSNWRCRLELLRLVKPLKHLAFSVPSDVDHTFRFMSVPLNN